MYSRKIRPQMTFTIDFFFSSTRKLLEPFALTEMQPQPYDESNDESNDESMTKYVVCRVQLYPYLYLPPTNYSRWASRHYIRPDYRWSTYFATRFHDGKCETSRENQTRKMWPCEKQKEIRKCHKERSATGEEEKRLRDIYSAITNLSDAL